MLDKLSSRFLIGILFVIGFHSFANSASQEARESKIETKSISLDDHDNSWTYKIAEIHDAKDVSDSVRVFEVYSGTSTERTILIRLTADVRRMVKASTVKVWKFGTKLERVESVRLNANEIVMQARLFPLQKVTCSVAYRFDNGYLSDTLLDKGCIPTQGLANFIGDYVSQECVASFEKTRSPYEASCRDAFSIVQDKDQYRFTRTYNFHEGASGIIKDLQYSDASNQYTFHVSNDLEGKVFRLGLAKAPALELIEIKRAGDRPSAQVYVKLFETFGAYFNRALQGDYQNTKADRFSFNYQGKGLWAGIPMSYQVGYDFVGCRGNYLQIHSGVSSQSDSYGWARKGSTIQIFKNDKCEENAEKPVEVIEELGSLQ